MATKKKRRHVCHAETCDIDIPKTMLFCKPHWFSLPKTLRDAIWSTYQRGQETGNPRPSAEYLANVREAQRLIAQRDGPPQLLKDRS